MIEAAFKERGQSVTIDPDHLRPAAGWYRTSPQADCFRWEGSGEIDGLTVGVYLYGVTTMTQIIKSGGATLVADRHHSNTSFDVYDATGN
jgi:hypothetical protein